MPITDLDVVAEAREYLGTPFQHLGRRKGEGVDCVGLLTGVAQALGVTSHDLGVYSPWSTDDTLVRELDKCLIPTAHLSYKPGMAVVFRIGRRQMHAGILAHHPSVNDLCTIIHALSRRDGRGKVSEHTLDEAWRDRIIRTYLFPKVVYSWQL